MFAIFVTKMKKHTGFRLIEEEYTLLVTYTYGCMVKFVLILFWGALDSHCAELRDQIHFHS